MFGLSCGSSIDFFSCVITAVCFTCGSLNEIVSFRQIKYRVPEKNSTIPGVTCVFICYARTFYPCLFMSSC